MRRRSFLRLSLAALAGAAAPALVGCGAVRPPGAAASPDPAGVVAVSQPNLDVAAVAVPALSAGEMLRRSWASYRTHFIQSDGRTMDPLRDMATTSEGQSYSLLQALWLDDRQTFDTVLDWTNRNLRVRGDALFVFLWGEREDGAWTVLDANIASDADQDIALALIFAHRRWGAESYLAQARAILADLWRLSVTEAAGRPYLTAGNWASEQERPVLNPSYLAPYAYRIFAAVDPERPWATLIDTSYDVLFAASGQQLDRGPAVGLPPNWCALDRQSAAIVPPPAELDTNFGYDAFRTYWRVALDARWYDEPRAIRYSQQSDFLRRVWQKEGAISSVYSHDGLPVVAREEAVIYGGLIGNMLVAEPVLAEQLYRQKLAAHFTEKDGRAYWDDPRAYYTQNWLWFGVALYAGELANFAV
jgi:endoglucanase